MDRELMIDNIMWVEEVWYQGSRQLIVKTFEIDIPIF